MKKKGQITVYVIIGLVALATVITALYAKDYIQQVVFKREIEKSLIIPEKARPIHEFVLSCLKETSDKAIKILGQQGGYTQIPRDPFPSTQLNLVSNALTVYGNNNVAYWFYEQPNKIQLTHVPSKKDMENQLSNYIENNIVSCLSNFQDFSDYEIIQGNMKVNSIINKDSVNFNLDFPINIKIRDFEFKINKFSQKIESPLFSLYEYANEIFENLNQENLLEHKTISMLISYEEIPYSGSTDDCIPPIWLISNVENNLKKIFSTNIQNLKVRGTNFEIKESDNNYFILDSNINDKDLDINFLYSENWPLFLDVNPRSGGLLKAQSVTEKLGPVRGLAESFVCLSNYHFIYDIKYPVLVILNKEDYTFQFALQVVIDNNEPRKSTITPVSIEGFNTAICDTRKNDLTVFTRDINNAQLENVKIEYKCINSLCEIGNTRINSFNEAVLTKKYPQCLNGALIATKENYHPAKQIISTLESSVTTLFLEPYKELDVDVLIERAGSGKIQEKDEQIYIQLSEFEKDHYETILYPDQNKIKLISGNYHAVIYLISNFPEGLDIKEQKIETCFKVPKEGVVSAIFKETEKKCITTTIPSTTVDKIISGYTEFDFTISESDLLNKKIIFHVPYIGKPTTLSQLNKAFENKNVPKPEFK